MKNKIEKLTNDLKESLEKQQEETKREQEEQEKKIITPDNNGEPEKIK